MNLKIKIDKYGNLVNLDTGTIILASNELFTDNFWETDGTTWKVNATTQVTASSTKDVMPTVVPDGFTQGSRVDFYFRLHLPILDYNKRVNIFEFSCSTAGGNDNTFFKLANSNNYSLYINSVRTDLPIASTESLDMVGVLTVYHIGSGTLAIFLTLYSNENGTLTKLVENAYRGSISGDKLYFGVSRDYRTNLSSYMIEGMAFDEDIIINPSNNNVNPISAVTKYLNDTGLSEVWTNTKNYISAQLLGKSDVGHTHTKSEITDFPTIPTKTSDLTNDSGFLTSHQDLSGYVPRSGGAVLTGGEFSRNVDDSYLNINAGTDWDKGAQLQLFGKDWSNPGAFVLYATLDANTRSMLMGKPDGTLLWNGKNVAMQEDTIPRSGGAVMGRLLARAATDGEFLLSGGTEWYDGAFIALHGQNHNNEEYKLELGSDSQRMKMYPSGTWTWSGTAVQLVSDQRFKQQISNIDDDLLTAWEDVNLVQFKYNDAVETKSDNARLHTGYVVQQIDEACKKHNVDVSKYGLYCHEEYTEETREVEHDDGTKTTEVVRPANEHYSLRYTEALIVECAYLRKCIKELRNEIEQLKCSK